ncbi:uncharacterized protein LOC110723166 [Chenopodium quinoa]|uniref:uncharacterized protein LOC110723166 n=1 Tax=Chenopodium quinoa TaxID=63459 RepID=UPI000B79A2E4|nr:uncharacterized protein LOC110723166 [Chenopodium quinoa]
MKKVKMEVNWDCQMPWLMLTDGNQDITEHEWIGPYLKPDHVESSVIVAARSSEDKFDDINTTRSLLDLTQEKVRCYNVECDLGYGRKCWGSSHGWILTQGIDDNMYLFNPLTKDRLDLPCRRTIPFLWDNSGEFLRAYFINRVVVLKVSGDTLVVVLMYDGYLRAAIAKPGDTQWTPIVIPQQGDLRRVMDVLYRRDNLGTDGLVFVNESGNIALVNLDDVQNKKPLALSWYGCYVPYIQSVFLHTDSQLNFFDHSTYIVNSGQDLLLVLRKFDTEINVEEMVREDEHDIDYYKTVNFKVYKFQFDDRSWEELKDLQDVALFVGNNATMSVRASEMGCQRNSIYFTDTYPFGSSATKDKFAGHDIGVFQMGDNIIRPLKLENNTHLRSSYCCPMWFRPAI